MRKPQATQKAQSEVHQPKVTKIVAATSNFIPNHIQHYLNIINHQPNQIFQT